MIFKNVKNINIPEGVVVKIATALDGIILWQKEKKIDIPNNEIWYTSTDGNIVTPKTITGNALISNTYENGVGRLVYENEITAVVESMFYEKSTLSTITLPNSIQSIEQYGFYQCSSLEDIIIPKSVKQLKFNSFAGCSSLINVTIPNSVESMSSSVFVGCTSLTNVTILTPIPNLGSYVFEGCGSLREIEIPNTITVINSGSFQHCTSLENVIIPNSVTKIEGFAFYNTGLENFVIPNSVTTIESNVVWSSKLKSITLPNSIQSFTKSVFSGNRNLNSIISPLLTAPSLGQSCFANAGADIPEGEKFIYIHQDADYESYTTGEWKTQLIDTGWQIRFIEEEEPENPDTPEEPTEPEEPEIVIPTGNTILYTTTDGEMLTVNSIYNPVVLSHTYENGIGRIEMRTIQDRVSSTIFDDAETRLKSITIGDGFPTIGGLADCINLEEVIMGDSVTTIEDIAFRDDTKLNKVVLSNEITEIPSECFSGCTSLANIVIPEKVTTIDASAFDETNLQEVIIPDSVTFLSSSAFWLCENLKSIVIGSGVTSLEEDGNYFFRCNNLGSITVKAIEAPALNGSTFGCGSKVEGDKILYIYDGATGYEAWLEKLPGFTIQYITE